MKRFLWAVVLLAVLLAGAGWFMLRQSRPLARLDLPAGTVGLPLDMSGGQLAVELTLGGRPRRFLVDTGASDIVLSPALATELGLARGEEIPATLSLGHTGLAARTTLPLLVFGTCRLENQPALIAPLAGPDGLLGWGFFSAGLVTLDLPGKTLSLSPGGSLQKGAPGVFPCTTGQDGVPRLAVLCDGAARDLLLDTGSGFGFQFDPSLPTPRLAGPAKPGPLGTSLAGALRPSLARLAAPVQLGALQFDHVLASLAPGESSLGLEVLRSSILTLDRRSALAHLAADVPLALRLVPGRKAVTQGPCVTTGLALRADGVVTDVIPGSPAGLAGLRAGDQCLTLDDQPVTSWSPETFRERTSHPGVTIRATFKRFAPGKEIPLTSVVWVE